MTLPNTSLIRKITLLLVAAMFSLSAMAADFDQTQREANQGNAQAQAFLGSVYYQGEGMRQDYTKAAQWFEKAANQGHAGSQFILGSMYARGEGVPQDYSKSMQWLEKSANQGDANAQYALGVIYNNGLGVRQNTATAKEYFGKACDNGNQDGCDDYRMLNQR